MEGRLEGLDVNVHPRFSIHEKDIWNPRRRAAGSIPCSGKFVAESEGDDEERPPPVYHHSEIQSEMQWVTSMCSVTYQDDR
jgi:hypothetical protein